VGLSWPDVLARLTRRESLTEAETEAILGRVLSGEATPVQIGAFLTLLHAKGEAIEEVTGLARALVGAAVPLSLDGTGADGAGGGSEGGVGGAEGGTADGGAAGVVVDLVGTGGDRLSSINVTTLASLIVAGCGVRVCKHGGRSASSSVGSADVLEALGVAIEVGPVGVARCVAEAGIGFCFAQRFHPAMRYVAPVRKELGVPTIFNFLGPLINPSRTRYQLVGVSDPAMATTMATVLGSTGSRRAMIIYADDGLDELSVTSLSTVLELNGDGDGSFDLTEWRVDPVALGLAPATLDDVQGGNAIFNAQAIRSVLNGAPGANRDIGLLNAAAGLMVAGRAADLAGGLVQAAQSIDSGRAEAALDALVAISQLALADELGAEV
jgi:anthranilate phosphoribosyltransferase